MRLNTGTDAPILVFISQYPVLFFQQRDRCSRVAEGPAPQHAEQAATEETDGGGLLSW